MTDAWDLTGLKTAVFDAAVDPSRWTGALEIVAEATGGMGAGLMPLRGGLPGTPVSGSFAEAMKAYVQDGWISRDIRYRGTKTLLRTGVATDLDFISSEEMDRHPYYQEWLRPFNGRWFVAVKIGTQEEQWVLSIQRTAAQGPYVGEELTQLARLARELTGAAELAQAFGNAKMESALHAFELSQRAVVMFNARGEVVRHNKSAEALMGADLRIQRRRLVSTSLEATNALDHALSAAVWSNSSPSVPVVLPRANNVRPLLAYVIRLTPATMEAFAPCHIVVNLVDLDAVHRPPPAALRSAFGLTPAEANLAIGLASGGSLSTVADELNIALETARHHLKSVFAKTGVSRQSELTSLLSRLLDARKPP